jgi:hypothetical protein
MISSRYTIFCIILSFIVLVLGFENYEIWSQSAGTVIKREVPKKPEAKAEPILASTGPREIPPPREEYKMISEKNIFNPDRKEFPVAGADDVSKKANTRPQVTLYGVVVGGEYQSATIVNPGRPLQKGEREARTVKVGDRIGDYKVAQILDDRIVIENAGDSFEVLLYDPSAPKRRMEVKTSTPPAAVTSSTGGPTPSPAPGTMPGPTPPAPGTAMPPSRTTPVSPGPPPGMMPSMPYGQQTVPPMTTQPVIPSPGTTLQPSGTQPSGTTTSPTPGIWRGRRPIQSGTQTGVQGN